MRQYPLLRLPLHILLPSAIIILAVGTVRLYCDSIPNGAVAPTGLVRAERTLVVELEKDSKGDLSTGQGVDPSLLSLLVSLDIVSIENFFDRTHVPPDLSEAEEATWSKLRENYNQIGIDRYYEITFADGVNLERARRALSRSLGIARAEFVLSPLPAESSSWRRPLPIYKPGELLIKLRDREIGTEMGATGIESLDKILEEYSALEIESAYKPLPVLPHFDQDEVERRQQINLSSREFGRHLRYYIKFPISIALEVVESELEELPEIEYVALSGYAFIN